MPARTLTSLADGDKIFVDANILIYAAGDASGQCAEFLERCLRSEVDGICIYEVLNEATHRLMLLEARAKRLITSCQARELRERSQIIAQLSDYWRDTERILNMSLTFVDLDERTVRAANRERRAAGLLTNDSMIVSCMRRHRIAALATSDSDFERVAGISVYKPTDV